MTKPKAPRVVRNLHIQSVEWSSAYGTIIRFQINRTYYEYRDDESQLIVGPSKDDWPDKLMAAIIHAIDEHSVGHILDA